MKKKTRKRYDDLSLMFFMMKELSGIYGDLPYRGSIDFDLEEQKDYSALASRKSNRC